MMSPEEFQQALAEWRATYGHTAKERTARSDQSLAGLYVRSGLTQRAIAEIEGITQKAVDFRLRFGRFLSLSTNGTQRNLTERSFRGYWAHTDKDATETDRFAAVAAFLQEETPCKPGMKGLGKQLVAQFSDGKFHRLRDMAEALDADMVVVRGICDRIVSQGTFQTFGERRPAPPKDGSYAYRFVKGGKKKIDLMAFSSEVQPVLDDMEMILNGPRKTDFSREAMQTAFAQLLKVLDSVAR